MSVLFPWRRVQFVFVEKEDVVGSVGELEITPVSAAIARHLNIDLSQEGRAARNRRGIAFVVHGAPVSGNSLRLRLVTISAIHRLALSLTCKNKSKVNGHL